MGHKTVAATRTVTLTVALQGMSTRSVDDLVKTLGMTGIFRSQFSRLFTASAELPRQLGCSPREGVSVLAPMKRQDVAIRPMLGQGH